MLNLKGWYEIQGSDLVIWEGVLVVHAPVEQEDNEFEFYKIVDGEVYEIKKELDGIQKVRSEGYWQCVEICGQFAQSRRRFLCHSTNPEHALVIFKSLPTIEAITIRLDPDPFRNWTPSKIESRLRRWKWVSSQLCSVPHHNIIIDTEMLN